jgi:hypothetical protein
MKLAKEDVKLFFDLIWSWQFFVKQKANKLKDIKSIDEYKTLPAEEKMIIRELCYNSPDLLDEYLAVNPNNFDAEKLAIMAQWKHTVSGKFYIERYLKKYAIFISEDTKKVYAVSALYDGFDEMIHKSHLPFYCETSLLSFKGRLVYDGLLSSYNIHFGGSMKRSLKDVYMKAKQNGKVIDSFETKSKKIKKTVHKSYSKEINALKKITKPLRGGTNQPPLNSPTFSLLKAVIELSEQSLDKSLDQEKIYNAIRKLDRARNKLLTVVERME